MKKPFIAVLFAVSLMFLNGCGKDEEKTVAPGEMTEKQAEKKTDANHDKVVKALKDLEGRWDIETNDPENGIFKRGRVFLSTKYKLIKFWIGDLSGETEAEFLITVEDCEFKENGVIVFSGLEIKNNAVREPKKVTLKSNTLTDKKEIFISYKNQFIVIDPVRKTTVERVDEILKEALAEKLRY